MFYLKRMLADIKGKGNDLEIEGRLNAKIDIHVL